MIEPLTFPLRDDSDYLKSPREFNHIVQIFGDGVEYLDYSFWDEGNPQWNYHNTQSIQIDVEYSGNGMYMGTACRKCTVKILDENKEFTEIAYGNSIDIVSAPFTATQPDYLSYCGNNFSGWVTEASRDEDTNIITVIAYDMMYFLSDKKFIDIFPDGVTSCTVQQLLNYVHLQFNRNNFPKLSGITNAPSNTVITNYTSRLNDTITFADINIDSDSTMTIREGLTQLGIYLGSCIMEDITYHTYNDLQLYEISKIRDGIGKDGLDLWKDKLCAYNIEDITTTFGSNATYIASTADPYVFVVVNKWGLWTDDKYFKYRYVVVDYELSSESGQTYNQYPQYTMAVYCYNPNTHNYEPITYTMDKNVSNSQAVFDMQGMQYFLMGSATDVRFRLDVLDHGIDSDGNEHEIEAGDRIQINGIYFTDSLETINSNNQQGVNNQQFPIHITQNDYYDIKYGEDYTLTQVAHRNELNDTVITGSSTGYCQIIDNNIFLSNLTDEQIQAKLNLLTAKAPQIRNYTLDWIGAGNLNFGTNMIIDVDDGEQIVTPYIPKTILYDGGLHFTSSFDIGETNQNVELAPMTISDSLKTTSAKVDKVNQQITLEVTNRTNADDELSSRITEQAGKISANVTEISGLNKWKSEFTMTPSGIESKVTATEETVEELTGTVANHGTAITQNAENISLVVITGSTGSNINISGIATAINLNDQGVTISGTKINFDGVSIFARSSDVFVTGTTIIDGGKIATSTITADSISANAITSGAITAGAITADKITSGAITSDKISAGAITAGMINANELQVYASGTTGSLTSLSSRLGTLESSIISSSGNSTYRQTEAPTENLKIGDLWYDTTNNLWKRWSGTKWVETDGSDVVRTDLQSQITQQAGQISAKVSQTDYDTNNVTISKRFTSVETDVSGLKTTVSYKVGNDEIISKINQSAEQITIQANKVNLDGFVTISSLTGGGSTTIDGGRISANSITAGSLSVGSLSADIISGGTITSSNISGVFISGVNISGSTIFSKDTQTEMLTVTDTLNIGSGNKYTDGRLVCEDIYIDNLNTSNVNINGIQLFSTGQTTTTLYTNFVYGSYTELTPLKARIGVSYTLSGGTINRTFHTTATVTYKNSSNVQYTTTVPITFYQGSNGGAGSVIVNAITGGTFVSSVIQDNTILNNNYSGLTGAFDLNIGNHSITGQHIIPYMHNQSASTGAWATIGYEDIPFNSLYVDNTKTNYINPELTTGTIRIGNNNENKVIIGSYSSTPTVARTDVTFYMTGQQRLTDLAYVINNVKLTNDGIEYYDTNSESNMTCKWAEIIYAIKRLHSLG